MVNLSTSTLQRFDQMKERKIRYDSTVVEHSCLVLEAQNQNIVLFHKIVDSFTMKANETKQTILKGSYTIAYYWKDRPYNLYIWRDNNGNYLGAYFNIVKNTYMTDHFVSFEDLIIDIMVLPSGDYFILDKDELPEPLDRFENGSVLHTLNLLTNRIDIFLSKVISETENTHCHAELLPWLNNR
jgi:predicted RNA-binding protein associated with RNAse of E/G family